MAYKAPIWEDGKSPAISAGNLNNLSRAAEGAQVLYGNSAPTSSTEGAVGQFYLVVVADDYGNYPLYQCVAIANGSYTWENMAIVPAKVAAAFNLPTGSVMSDVLLAASAPRLISSYEVAGSYQWTAPDLIGGKPYKIGVLVIGGGASGGASSTEASKPYYLAGGPSGYSNSAILTVKPGDKKNLVVGSGGAPATATMFSVQANAGNSSSFDSIVANGGERPYVSNGYDTGYTFWGATGTSNPYERRASAFGTPVRINNQIIGISDMCVNPFTGERILGGGGNVIGSYDAGTFTTYSGGKDPITGKGGGDGAASKTANVVAESASAPGCGGGAAISINTNYTATSGAGADGAVYIYFLGVADE